MKRKLVSIVLLGCMILGLVGCSTSGNGEIAPDDNIKIENNNEEESNKNDKVEMAVAEGLLLEAIGRYEKKEIPNYDTVYLFRDEVPFELATLNIETIMKGYTHENPSRDSSMPLTVEELKNMNPTYKTDTNMRFRPDKEHRFVTIVETEDIANRRKEDKGFAFINPNDGNEFTFLDAYNTNCWTYSDSYTTQLEKCLGISDNKDILWEGEYVFDTFGTPESIWVLNSQVDSYLTSANYDGQIGHAMTNLVYDLGNFKLILTYTEYYRNDGTAWKQDLSYFEIVTNEAYESQNFNCNFTEVWNEKDGYVY